MDEVLVAADTLFAALAGLLKGTGAPAQVLAGVAVLARVSGALALLPGLGERTIPMRLRLAIALAMTALLLPLVPGLAALMPSAPMAVALVIVAEAGAGIVIGTGFRLLIYVLQIAGTIASQSITISHIFGNGVAQEAEPSIASFLAMGGIALALISGLHVNAVAALAALYAVLPFGLGITGEAAAVWSSARVSSAFAMALGLATPFVLVGFAYNLALGALSRAMPQLLVALVGVPLLVGLGLGTLWLVLPEMLTHWLVLNDIATEPSPDGPWPGAPARP